MRRVLLLVVAAVVVAAVLFATLRTKPVAVDLVTVAAADVQTSVVASGRVLPPSKVEIGATITGRVEKVLVREGARIEANQLLVELCSRSIHATSRCRNRLSPRPTETRSP